MGLGALLLAACGDPTPAPGPAETVLAIHTAWTEGRTDEMRQHFAYEALLASQLGQIWESANLDDRQRALEQLHAMMLSTTERMWKHIEGRQLWTTVRHVTDDEAWVSAEARNNSASHGDQTGFMWRYRAIRFDGVWKVAQREFTLNGHHSNTRRFYPMVAKQLRREYGKTPTLSELVANLPSIAKRMRIRSYRVPPPEELNKLLRNKRDRSTATPSK